MSCDCNCSPAGAVTTVEETFEPLRIAGPVTRLTFTQYGPVVVGFADDLRPGARAEALDVIAKGNSAPVWAFPFPVEVDDQRR
jgi:hypothetical protein